MKIELHAHTSAVSRCAHSKPDLMVKTCKESGYDAVVVTEHYSNSHLSQCVGMSFDEMISAYMRGYYESRNEGEKIGLRVFFGIELCCDPGPNDYLIYGADEKFLRSAPVLPEMQLTDIIKILPESALVYQAHPFRDNMRITPPERLFGIEVFNGNLRHNSRNSFARLWAEKYGLNMISGSDYHDSGDPFCGGAEFYDNINSEAELVTALKSGKYELITDSRA
ncbi:hypothetical protein SDC9_124717 [bioreactor metagenome]|uniref:PHP domain-containing protein n=1 Tax=bioreactor metagenome TaxID=1076179 RepID=A0A645CLB9_9ZZZZ|nr:PHP domain-containing protein [Oscillospiraceae bacterium]